MVGLGRVARWKGIVVVLVMLGAGALPVPGWFFFLCVAVAPGR